MLVLLLEEIIPRSPGLISCSQRVSDPYYTTYLYHISLPCLHHLCLLLLIHVLIFPSFLLVFWGGTRLIKDVLSIRHTEYLLLDTNCYQKPICFFSPCFFTFPFFLKVLVLYCRNQWLPQFLTCAAFSKSISYLLQSI